MKAAAGLHGFAPCKSMQARPASHTPGVRRRSGSRGIPEECNGVIPTSCLNRVGSMSAVGWHGGGVVSA